MGASAPTARGYLNQAKTTYISWGNYDFELTGNNVYRPGLSAANETEVVSTFTLRTGGGGQNSYTHFSKEQNQTSV